MEVKYFEQHHKPEDNVEDSDHSLVVGRISSILIISLISEAGASKDLAGVVCSEDIDLVTTCKGAVVIQRNGFVSKGKLSDTCALEILLLVIICREAGVAASLFFSKLRNNALS